MRKTDLSMGQDEDGDEINLTPMLDVVFIMLIFFIVTASFAVSYTHLTLPTTPYV